MKLTEDDYEKARKWDMLMSQLKEDHGWHYFKNGEVVHLGVGLEFDYGIYGIPIHLFEKTEVQNSGCKLEIDHCAINLQKILGEKNESRPSD